MLKTPVEIHFDLIAKNYDYFTEKRKLHYSVLKRILVDLIGTNKNVLEIGCGTGDLLYFLKPKRGMGIDISSKMIQIASNKYRNSHNLRFSRNWPSSKFDYIFMSDVIEHLEDRKKVFKKISGLMNSKSIFINTMMNPVWWPIERMYTYLGLKMPEGPHFRAPYKTISLELQDLGLKVIKHDYKLLVPIHLPFITWFANSYLEKYLKKIAFIEYFVCVKD